MSRFLLNVPLLLLALVLSSPLWAGDAIWIDVRTAEEFNAEHVTGAVNIPYEEIAGRIGEVTEDRNAPIYVYCRSGRRSGIAQDALAEAGFNKVTNAGGLEEAIKMASEMAVQ
jgi:phage shock protein E